MSTLGSFIWSIADQLRGPYRPNQYGNVILPLTILRRLDCILEPDRETVRKLAAKYDNPNRLRIEVKKATGRPFYNTSNYSFANLLADADGLADNLADYIDSKGTAVDISLTGDGELKGISAAGTGTRKEPKYVALQIVIDKMNDLFGAESFTESQLREFVQGLVQRLLAYPDLINQTKVNSKKQFMESQDFQAAVIEAMVENQEAHNTMADYFFSDGPGISAVIVSLADAFYEAAIDQRTDG